MRYISLFAGIGGFDLALNRLGHECVYANEWDKYSAQTYEKNFGHKPDTRDIRTVSSTDIPDHELLVGGFPCQAFSIAGKRLGFNETRGTLFFEIARLLKDKRPRYFLLENVKGLLNHDSGKTFSTILGVLTDLGYEYEWQVLNSKNFGVPQNRERVFIIGSIRGQSRSQVFPIGESSKRNTETQGEPQSEGERIRSNDISCTVNTRFGSTARGQQFIAGSLRVGGGDPLKFLNRNQKNIEGDYAYTVDGANTGGIMQDMRIRRLTPIECLRLQGFPDNWFDVKGLSDTQKYKQAGNAVTVNVIEEIMKRFIV